MIEIINRESDGEITEYEIEVKEILTVTDLNGFEQELEELIDKYRI